MNPVEIEQELSDFAEQPFDPIEFPFLFLECFGNKATTLKRLRSGASNKSDVENGVLQRSNIHLATCDVGEVSQTLQGLRNSPATTKAKAPFVLATDGHELQAENVITGEMVVSDYKDFPDHFGFFLPLAGIATTAEIRNNPIDIKATGRLNRLYVELLKHDEDWGSADRRHDMNQFMTRLIFCFFAEDTGIFQRDNMFTRSVEQMSDSKSENTHDVVSTLFHALDLEPDDREKEGLPRWTKDYPYVNGGLFAGTRDVPKFSRIARSCLIHAGNLNWKEINPDIFGSMIQAVADDEERGSIGMHYTSVPNILKVLNPLFLDDLKDHVEKAGDNARKLINLKKRISKIRVFDPACGSGNFLVIAYKEMRAIEFEINKRRRETHLRSDIPLNNFRGIEIREFPTEIARLALVIAEYQCDELYRGQKDALADFLPLDSKNWIVSGNALRLDWLSICPPAEKGVKHLADDLFHTPLEQTEVDFENEGGETFICGNPPYLGSTWQSKEQKADLESVFQGLTEGWKSLDYVTGWFMKAADYGMRRNVVSAFVSTNSICQGQQVPILWPLILNKGAQICFAHTSFKWKNLAKNNAGVTVIIVGLGNKSASSRKKLFSETSSGEFLQKEITNINAYLIPQEDIIVEKSPKPLSPLGEMTFGSKPTDGGHLILSSNELEELKSADERSCKFIHNLFGSDEFINGKTRYCIWIKDEDIGEAMSYLPIKKRTEKVKLMRSESKKAATRMGAKWPHRFDERRQNGDEKIIVVPAVSSENRDYLPCGILPKGSIITNRTFGLFNKPLSNLAILVSRIHWVWIDAVCGKLKTDFNYSNTIGWNTFPVPTLTEKNKVDLKRCAEDILLARESHFPKTIADLYKPDEMPDNLKQAHEKNDETLERIYIGRRFKNDTERLEKLFELYTKMKKTGAQS
jgi:hypothetical protein